MNVKMSFTVDLEEVPERIRNEFKNMTTAANSFSLKIQALSNVNNMNPIEMTKQVIALREQLMIFDLRLDDCFNALSGYCEYSVRDPNAASKDQVDQPPAQTAPPQPTDELLAQMAQKANEIKKMQETMTAQQPMMFGHMPTSAPEVPLNKKG